jgi:hypothetical protein
MMPVIRFIGLLLVVVVGIAIAAAVVAVAAFVGLIVHLALFGAPFIIFLAICIRDWYIDHLLKKAVKKK